MDRTRWTLVALIFCGGLLAAAQFGKITLTLPQVAQAFDRPVTAVAFLVSLVGIMGLMLGPMAGGIAAGHGIGRTFLAGLVLGGAMSLVQATLPPIWLFSASRAVEGVAHLALVVAGPPLMAGASSDADRPLVMGLWAVFFGASLALSAQIFPGLLAAGGLPLLFALHGALMLVLAAVMWRIVPRLSRAPISLNPVTVHREIYGSIRYMAPGLGFVCYTFLFIAAIAFLPDALGRPALATILPLVTLVSTLAGGALCRRFAPHHVGAAGYAGTALGALGLALGLPFAVEACFVFMGLIPGASFASIPAWNAAPGDRARATGAIAQLGNLGTVTGTPLFAVTFAAGGLTALIWLTVGVALLGLILVSWAGARASGSAGAGVLNVR
ncbi:MFS transporter [Jannaschia donghaensis]|uniref:Major Facilitator Superfamily protein n=1 Tax=Jannaschia donghaensis TaxID=420998 RepID=A0A0M6YL25_9RHOB|nr:MFS transporter [Jannaschia donghaensis]CTQ51058.1 Major Facilitator Superfamily protein [Jannaschia donghaensis]